ncbi:MAG: periplasmic heavy metal sensor [Pseudomonadota bacterium]|nr:periplasmic heavy metal sensor [Pseudomonadota bacterium]
MKDQEANGSEPSKRETAKPFRPWRTRILAWTLGAVMGGMAVGAVSHARMGGGWCGPIGHGPWGGVGDEYAEERRQWIGFGIERMLSRVDASDQQKTEVKAVVERLARDMDPAREQLASNRKALVQLLTEPEIDRAGLETLRSRQMVQAEAISAQLVTALGDAAEVLTPQQRTELAERFRPSRH